MRRKISILGSTGSVGTATLEVIRQNREQFQIIGLSCQNNLELLVEQIYEFKPKIISVGNSKASTLKEMLGSNFEYVQIVEGEQGNKDVANYPADTIVSAIVGSSGLLPLIESIHSKKDILLANKEPIVLAGEWIMRELRSHEVQLFPLDSEHNAIFQCLQGSKKEDVTKVTLTSSGGPFRTWDIEMFPQIKLQDALQHPVWNMGSKITVDSATMMNKALEIIEAKWLFDLPPESIDVVVHPESIIHSLVHYKDGSTLAQMGYPDMKIPIAYCLNYPNRINSGIHSLDLLEIKSLHFENIDCKKFPTVSIAYEALKMGGSVPAVLNGANELLVSLFLKEQIYFIEIFEMLNRLIYFMKTNVTGSPNEGYSYLKSIEKIEDAIRANEFGKEFVTNCFELKKRNLDY